MRSLERTCGKAWQKSHTAPRFGDNRILGATANPEINVVLQDVVAEKYVVATRPQQARIPPALALFRFPKSSISA